MKNFANVSLISLALIALLSGAALADTSDFYSDDESGYQDQAAGFKALLDDHSASDNKYELQNKVDVNMARAFSEIQVSPSSCTANDKEVFLALLDRTNKITDELGFE